MGGVEGAVASSGGISKVSSVLVEEEREASGITIEVLQQHFHQPLVTVADELGVSLTVRHPLLYHHA